MRNQREFVFGSFRLDLCNEQLWQGQEPIHLKAKEFAVLRCLITYAGQLVTKDVLFKEVWPETMVGEAVLTVAVRQLRRVLGDRAREPQFIATVHRRGYRFIAPVNEAVAHPVESESAEIPSLPQTTPRIFPTTLVGREPELDLLNQWFATALQGKRQVGFITGEAGIGKTTLVNAFMAQVSGLDDLWIGYGQCVEQYGAGEAYLPILEALSRLCREQDEDQIVGLLRKYAPSWLIHLPAVLSLADYEALHKITSSVTQTRMLRELSEVLEALTVEHPLLLVLEDLHWSDSSSLELLSYVARRHDQARLLILGTYRQPVMLETNNPLLVVTQELHLHGHCLSLPLSYLSEKAIQDYLDSQFPEQVISPGLSLWLYQRTEGNPLFLVSIIDHILNEGMGKFPVDVAEWDNPNTVEVVNKNIPDSLQRMIEGQLGKLSLDEQQVLKVGSVVGVTFAAAAVAAGLEDEVEQVEIWCEGLVRQSPYLCSLGVEVWPDGTVSERYGFIHTIYREVIYDQISAAQCLRFHLRISARLEQGYGDRVGEHAAELAIHYELGRDYWQATHYRWQAAELALQRQAYQESIEHLTQGLRLIETLPDIPERTQHELLLSHALGAALMTTKGFAVPAVEQAYNRSHALCQRVGDSSRLFRVLLGLGAFHFARGEYSKAHELDKQALSLAQRIKSQSLLSRAHEALGQTLLLRGEFIQSQRHLNRGIAFYSSKNHHSQRRGSGFDPEMNCRAYLALVLVGLGYMDQARKIMCEALNLARDLSHAFTITGSLHYSAVLHQVCREEKKVQELSEAWVFRMMILSSTHADLPRLPYESACNSRGSKSTKRQ